MTACTMDRKVLCERSGVDVPEALMVMGNLLVDCRGRLLGQGQQREVVGVPE